MVPVWSRAEEILDRLLDDEDSKSLDDESVRAALEGEPEPVRSEVESLLVHLRADSVLAEDLASSLPGLLDALAQDQGHGAHTSRRVSIGDELGAYRLIEEIGRGGMGVVFLAERADRQFEKRVALKVISATALGAEARRRFLRERQILAELEHPSIARLLDGGVGDDGSPFLVMELVEGEPIDVHCRRIDAPLERRLELFLEVCDAVRAAHERLIVHRDIKPPNVLVDAEGRVKLLDFGIAGLVEETDAAPAATVMHAFTPEYASPEQIRLERAGTASDVYSLGVLLYTLLAGRPPYETRGLRPAEVERVVCEVEPDPPSVALASDTELEPRTRSRRARKLRGDLDHVVLAALAKDTARRYPSAAELALDLRRYRQGQPVEARPATAGYRARRFVARHRVPVAATCAIVLSLVVGLAVAASQASRAARERDLARTEAAKASAVSAFLTELFQEASPFEGEEPTAADLLARGESKIVNALSDHPEARADLLIAMAEAYRGLGDYGAAQRLTAEALEIQRIRHPEPDPELAEALLQHGLSFTTAGDRERGVELVREALDALLESGDEVSELGARTHRSLGNNARTTALEDAARHLERAAEIQQQVAPGESVALGLVLHDLAIVREEQGRSREGLEMKQRALEMIEPRVEPGAPVVHQIQGNLALSMTGAGRLDEATELYRAAIAGLETRLGPEHPSLLSTLTSYGRVLLDTGRFDEATEPIERAVALGRGSSSKSFGSIGAVVNLATLYRELGRLEEASRLYRSTLEDFAARGIDAENPAGARVESLLAETTLRLGRPHEARESLERALASQEAAPGVRASNLAETRASLGDALCTTEEVGTGREVLERACRDLGAGLGEENWQVGACDLRLAACAARGGDRELARDRLANAERLLADRLPRASYWPQRLADLRAELSVQITPASPTGEP